MLWKLRDIDVGLGWKISAGSRGETRDAAGLRRAAPAQEANELRMLIFISFALLIIFTKRRQFQLSAAQPVNAISEPLL
jgi:hypothetical protein